MANFETLVEPLLIIVVLVAIALGVMLYALRRLKARRAQLLSQLQESPELVEDRAFNRLRMANSEADILQRQGTDVSRARTLLNSAQEAFDQHNYPSALSRAQSAHETLVSLRHGASLPSSRIGEGPGLGASPIGSLRTTGSAPARPSIDPSPTLSSMRVRSRDSSPSMDSPTAPPRNRAESRFQISVLTDEISQARLTRAQDPSVAESEVLRAQASSAYDRAEYTEALRLALKARRRIGGRLETLPPTNSPSGGGDGSLSSSPGSEVDVAERTAESARCPQCGAPLTPADKFCRGCGTPRAERSCPRCQQLAQPGDTFCGNCGTALT